MIIPRTTSRLRMANCLLACLALWACSIAPAASPATRPAPAVQTYRQWVNALADESMEGRGPGTKGLVRARDYLIEQFKAMGLGPTFGESFTQPFTMVFGVDAKEQALAIVDRTGKVIAEARAGRDFNALGFAADGSFQAAPVFVGYGIVSRDHDYDSFAHTGADTLRGKVAVAFRYEPQDAHGRSLWAKGSEWTSAAALVRKARWAAEHGATALLIVNPPSRAARASLHTARGTASWPGEKIPVMHVSLNFFKRMLESAGMDGDQAAANLQARADAGTDKPVELKGARLRGRVTMQWARGEVHNVAAVVRGAGKLAEQVVIVGAHYDHLGYGGIGSRTRERAIHPGADDNASGTAGALMLAKWFADRAAGRSAQPAPASRRTLVFAAFAGEERGLLGSAHMAGHLADLGIRRGQLVAMINMDMIGRLRKRRLRVGGVGSGTRWGEIVRRASAPSKLDVQAAGSAFAGSDHMSFYFTGVPVLFICTGSHEDVHTPRDTPEKIDAAGAVEVLRFVDAIVLQLWTDPDPPAYKPVRPLSRMFGGSAYLGVRADPATAGGADGCRLLDVLPETPAEKAGLKPGDVIVAWDGQAIPHLEALLSRLRAAKPDQQIKLAVRRSGQVLQIPVKLGRR